MNILKETKAIDSHLSTHMEVDINGHFISRMESFELQFQFFNFWKTWTKISPIIWLAVKICKKVVFWKKAYWILAEAGLTILDEIAKKKTNS